ncbi:MAG: DUF87 domain-containing protein [Gemmatimonadetes bacterium]|nr:DUF87 domain-containing protein [Gemmatimonadota bacterium]
MGEPKKGDLFLGGVLDTRDRERTGEEVHYGARRFTTHGVIVGMTGSGKTGLGVVLLEEVLLSGVPALILDPKGDMGNLLLNFPELRGEDFRPWIDEAEASRKGQSPAEFATATADMWREGLGGWGIEGERLRRLKEAAEFTIYTPGSTAGVPLNVVGSLAAPKGEAAADAEVVRDEIEGFVTSLLSLAGIDADPITSPEHVLLASIVEHAWSRGEDLGLASLISRVQDPPLRKLGVFELDAFIPPGDRRKLALRLNGLMASPSFAAWLEGEPLEVERLLRSADGRPKASVLYLAHLSDEERQFVVTLVLSKMITWMRTQPGTSDLRALIYMDEVFGFVPPTAAPPSKKPILTILKQARAHGLGLVLSTQNPVDLDYKAMSNAGTWMVGRLQTERDKARILEALESATGSVDTDLYDQLIGGLGKRQFVLQSTKAPEPTVFTTRWAMSYLRGAITRDEVSRLMEDHVTSASAGVGEAQASPAEEDAASGGARGQGRETGKEQALAPDESPVAPAVPDSVPMRYLHPSADWAAHVGAGSTGRRMRPGLAVRVALRFDDRVSGIDASEEWEAVSFPAPERFDPEALQAVDYDDRDWIDTAPEGARYVVGGPDLGRSSYYRDFSTQVREHLYRSREITVFRNKALKMYSRVGESEAEFLARCDGAAEDRSDEEVAKLKEKFEARIDRVEDQRAAAEARVRELEVDVSGRQQTEVVSAAGDLLSMFVGGRRRSRRLSGLANRRAQTRRAQQRLQTAEEKVADRTLELDELEDQLGEEIQAVTREWEEAAREIEPVEIGLEKNDIHVEDVVLFWAPVG